MKQLSKVIGHKWNNSLVVVKQNNYCTIIVNAIHFFVNQDGGCKIPRFTLLPYILSGHYWFNFNKIII